MKTLLLTIIFTFTTSVAAAVYVTDINTQNYTASIKQLDKSHSESVFTDNILMAIAEPVSSILPLSQPSR